MPRKTLEELDLIFYEDEWGRKIFHKGVEREEQVDMETFIPPHACVLELGGRYGMVSAVINHRLDNPLHHIVLEPDRNVLAALEKNKKSHDCHFQIWPGALSSKPLFLIHKSFASYCVSEQTNDSAPVTTYSLSQIQGLTGLPPFTHLVADCEGALPTLWAENREVFRTLEGVYFELDNCGPHTSDYSTVLSDLQTWGFIQKKEGKRQIWEKSLNK